MIILHKEANSIDIFKAYFHAYYLKNLIIQQKEIFEKSFLGIRNLFTVLKNKKKLKNLNNQTQEYIENSLSYTKKHFNIFIQKMNEKNWNLTIVKLNQNGSRAIWNSPLL